MTVAEWIGRPQNFLGFVIMTDAFFPSLRVIAELGVADRIDDAPVPVRVLAEACGADERSLRRLLRFVAAEGLLRMTDDDNVEHTELSRSLRSDHPLSVRNALLLRNHFEAFTKLLEGVRTGQSPHLLRFGKGYWENLSEHPDLVGIFSATMTLTTRLTEDAIFAAHEFRPFKLAVDVGGSAGSLLRRLLAGNPSSAGILFDLPDVVRDAEKGWAGAPDAPRLHAVGGSFFDSVPAGADLYMLKQILHDWDDAHCVKILKKVREAIAPRGRLAIFEILLPERNAPHPGWAMDVSMMTLTHGGERKLSEYEALLGEAEFELDRVTPTQSTMNVVEAVPV